MFKSPIAISLSPNTESTDVWEAMKILFQPCKWKKGKSIENAESWFKEYFKVSDAVSFNSGRSALMAILQTFNIGQGDEVLIQAFTCVAVPDPIIWVGAKPIYVDIDESLNIDSKLLEKHINSKTRAIIVQHTFGIPAKIEMIKKIAQKYNLILIEDCAHSLGATLDGKKVGIFGDAAFFSFGRDKVISSVFGGMAIISSKLKTQSSKLREFQKSLSYPGYFWIFQQLLHPIAFAIILPIYNFYMGKLLLLVLQKLHLLSFPVYTIEKTGGKPPTFPAKYPNALAQLLLVQLKKLEKYNQQRRNLANYYFERLKSIPDIKLPVRVYGAIYLRFNILTKKSEEILKTAKGKRILLGNWYKQVVDPKGVDYEKIGYEKGICPKAEEIANLSVNLPTYPKLTVENLNLIADMLSA
jgi:dTDP-4-amino-4,6-dideoxygalactose transaminase